MKRVHLHFSTLLLFQLLLLGCLASAAFADGEPATEEEHTHEYVLAGICEPTCMEEGYSLFACVDGDDRYFDEYTDPLGHDWDAGHISVEPTMEAEGEIIYTCLRCQETRSESIPALEPEPDAEPEPETEPTWNLVMPARANIEYGSASVDLEPASIRGIRDLGSRRIYLTIQCDCIFTGDVDVLPVMLFVDGVPVPPGEPAIYGFVTADEASLSEITLVFSDDAWTAIASGTYSMEVFYSSHLG